MAQEDPQRELLQQVTIFGSFHFVVKKKLDFSFATKTSLKMPSEFRVLMNDLVSTPPPSENVADFSPRKKKVEDVIPVNSSSSSTSTTTSISSSSSTTTTATNINTNNTKVVELEALVAELEKQLAIASGANGQSKMQIAKLEGEVKAHKSDVLRSNEQQRASQDKAIALDAVVKDLSARMAASETEVATCKDLLEKEKAAITLMKDANEKSLSSLRSTHEKETAAHAAEVKTLKATIDASKKESATLKEEIERVKKESDKLHKEVEKLNKDHKSIVDGLKAEVVALKAENSSTEAVANDAKKQLASLQSSLRSAQNEASTSQQTLETVQKDLALKLKTALDEKGDATSRMQTAVSEASKLRARAEAAEKRAEGADNSKRMLEISLNAERTSTEERLAKMSASITDRVEQAQARVVRAEEALKRGEESLAEQLKSKSNEINALKRKLMEDGAMLEKRFKSETDRIKSQEWIYFLITAICAFIALVVGGYEVSRKFKENEDL
jgi:chromosome segregation ATPase